MKEKVGIYIKRWRVARAMTQDDFAKLCGVSRATIVYIENGYVNVSFRTLKKIANAMGRKLSFLHKMFAEELVEEKDN